jgi:hypothetical protein
MSNDAKLGLVLGLAIVLLIALVFFRGDTPEAQISGHADRMEAGGQPAWPPAPKHKTISLNGL